MVHGGFIDKSEYILSFYAAVENCLGEVACAKTAGGDAEGQGRSGEDEAREEEGQASSLAEVAPPQAVALAALSAAAAQVRARCLDLVAAAALPPRRARAACCVLRAACCLRRLTLVVRPCCPSVNGPQSKVQQAQQAQGRE